MIRGLWIKKLLIKTINNHISIKDATILFFARFRTKPLNLRVLGLEFSNVDHILWSIIIDVFVNEVYTPHGHEINENDIVVDIGAHQGVFSAYASQKTQANIKSYEPNTINFSRLCNFIARNNIANIEPNQYAIAAEPGESFLIVSNTSSTHYLSRVDNHGETDRHQYERIQTKSLDQILMDVDHVDLLKIDCEGAEVEIFLSASEKTLKKVKKISAETHYPFTDPRFIEMIEKLSPHFASIKLIHGNGRNLGYLFAK